MEAYNINRAQGHFDMTTLSLRKIRSAFELQGQDEPAVRLELTTFRLQVGCTTQFMLCWQSTPDRTRTGSLISESDAI